VAQTDAVDPPLELEGAADRVTIEKAVGGFSVRATSEESGGRPWRDETAVATTIEGREKLVTRFLGDPES
jgi:hypothetical protein